MSSALGAFGEDYHRPVAGPEATDGYGMAAYLCAADQGRLEPVADRPGVLRCATCGYHTDTPGVGVLGDGFDMIHRQWGLRADPHAWEAMRELVAGTPTPLAPDAVRAAYIAALGDVADVDIDHTEEAVVYRRDLDHGGMSGGGVDVEWWRTKGIPLLVDRAMTRRPPAAAVPAPGDAAAVAGRGRLGKVLGGAVIWLILLAIPAGLVGGGGFLLYQRAVGTRVDATVLECDTSGTIVRGASTFRTDCIAEWTIDGRTIVGAFSGGNGESDVGKTVAATVRGDTAYSRSLILPILLIVLGSPFLALPIIAIRSRRRRRVRPVPDPGVTGTGVTPA